MSVVGLRIPDTLEQQVEKLAEHLQRSKSFIIRKALETYINEYADYQIAIERLYDKDDEIVSASQMRGLLEGKHSL